MPWFDNRERIQDDYLRSPSKGLGGSGFDPANREDFRQFLLEQGLYEEGGTT